jgi:DNA mismatch repair protein MutL
MKVRVLPDQLINQISAGEVVERPASVVRELLDNALDAGGTDITVALEEGGRSSIRISDNGCGMTRDDALLALERHATSKIREATDLNEIMTLGFRGEALPSIAAVARLRMKTRPVDAEAGTEIYIEGGKIRDVKNVACNVGTDIEVSRIFFNTPVRRKFLKSPKTEEQRIRSWLQNVALSRPNVRLRLFCDGREQLNFPSGQNEKERARLLFRGSHVEFSRSGANLKVSGLVGHPSLALADTASFVVLVNGRVVSDRLIMKAVKEGFDSTLKEREFPVGYVNIAIPPREVDVNVHPQKSEVRFTNAGEIFQCVRDAVLEAVRTFKSAVPFAAPQAFRQPAAPSWEPQPREFVRPGLIAESGAAYTGADATPAHRLEVVESPPLQNFESVGFPGQVARNLPAESEPDFRFSDLKFVGQIMHCYLICELRGRLYIVDMHAAHERYNYNLIRNAFEKRALPVQKLLLPLRVELGERGISSVEEHAELLNGLGFEFHPVDGALEINSAPALIKGGKIVEFFKDVAACDPEAGAGGRFKELLDHIAARLACHASVRSGQDLSREEVYSLFAAMDSSEFSAACPHGRPVIVSFRAEDVEAWFGRDR